MYESQQSCNNSPTTSYCDCLLTFFTTCLKLESGKHLTKNSYITTQSSRMTHKVMYT